LQPEQIESADLSVVHDLASATRALHLIVVQGEGAPSESEASHFETFSKIKKEYLELRAERHGFEPSQAVARNPVMRRPVSDDRVHVTAPAAAAILDAANAIYALLLRYLTAVYDTPGVDGERRKALLGCALGLMKLLASISDELTKLPADDRNDARAGVTFAMLRSTEGFAPGVDSAAVLCQRFDLIRDQPSRVRYLASDPC
jgi:hypothetical protein